MSEAQTQSPPPIQIMDKAEGFDPYRIPSSVFETAKPPTNMEWSMASNESLFSIHPGNSSFSRDQILLMDKSGELETLWSSSPEVMEGSRVLAGLEEAETPEGFTVADCGNSVSAGNVGDQKSAQESNNPIGAAAATTSPVSTPQSPAGNRPSYGSTGTPSSTMSFAFPILTAVDPNEKSASSAKFPDPEEPPAPTSEPTPTPPPPPPQPYLMGWFSCICSRPRCC